MEIRDRRHAVAQSGDLADHVHALLPLLRCVDRDELVLVGYPINTLRRDSKASDVELLQPAAELLRHRSPRPAGCVVRPANCSTNGDGRQRVAWPGPLSSRAVSSAATAAS